MTYVNITPEMKIKDPNTGLIVTGKFKVKGKVENGSLTFNFYGDTLQTNQFSYRPKNRTKHYKKHKLKLLQKQGYKCLHCRCNFYLDPEKATIDHILARSNGGTNNIENLQILCRDCHDKKTVKEKSDNYSVRLNKEMNNPFRRLFKVYMRIGKI